VVASAAILAALAAFLTTSGGNTASLGESYQATSILVDWVVANPGSDVTGNGFGTGTNLDALATLAKLGDVADRAAQEMGYQGDPADLADEVTFEADSTAGLFRITANGDTPKEAEDLANAYAGALVDFMADGIRKARSDRAEALLPQVQSLNKDIADLQDKIATAPQSQLPTLNAQLAAKTNLYQELFTQLQALQQPVAATEMPIQQVGTPQAEVVSPAGLQAPRSRFGRVLLGLILGLAAGIVLALLLERFDTKIRGRQDAEESFGVPVLATIPVIPRDRRRRIAGGADSPAADAFRLLSAGLRRARPTGAGRRATTEPHTILVTSPSAGEGKSTVVASLAASYAETGKKVIVVSCDFRRPSIHLAFDLPNVPGLAEAIETRTSGPVLNGAIRETPVHDVSLVASGVPHRPSSELLSSPAMHSALAEARSKADVVLLDTAPILAGVEASYLMGKVDSVLLVARAGRTSRELARRTGEVLRQLGSPVVGVALNGSRDVLMPRGYYYRPKHAVRSDA
jgi:capsular exopolysaccharide synthesis family protein